MSPWHDNPMQRMQRHFDNLFNRLWTGSLMPFEDDMATMRTWDFDLREKDNEIMVRAELPGFEENEIDVQLNDNVLTIRAEKEQKGDSEEQYVNFYRSVTLPAGMTTVGAQATYRNGVLELHLPRSQASQAKRIQIQKSGNQKTVKMDQNAGTEGTDGNEQKQSMGKTAEKAKK